MSGVIWTFYEPWVAFPRNERERQGSSHVAEFYASVDQYRCDANGAFAVHVFDFRRDNREGHDWVLKFETYGDSFAVVAASGVLVALGESGDSSPAGVRAVLLGLGWEDETARLRGSHPSYCDKCDGYGVLDDVAPSDRVGLPGQKVQR